MTTQATNQSRGRMDDLLPTLTETSARAALTAETLGQTARRQVRPVKASDGLVGLHLPSGGAGRLEAMGPTSQTVRSSAADQLAASDSAAVLERTTTLLQAQVELIARLSEELAEERQRREAAESAKAALQKQLAELERSLRAGMSGLTPECAGAGQAVQESHKLANMEDQARDWIRRSRKKPRNARRWLRRNIRRLLASSATI